eukprot:CAMPEP_0183720522 /NCGR_PEP_ID=MMETSP0737-20130205/13113_1 /TAXON_ID=385413 /ORGANISM="Thalassiosira miniscula, Strain CCMP1093" /LENGTH=1088 /DNA_ID=CAMNT_0025950397 /DNA_START=204 /DNA_END=3470 /DNA_ORIENTATION=+
MKLHQIRGCSILCKKINHDNRIRRSSDSLLDQRIPIRRSHRFTYAALLLLGVCIQTSSPFSIPIASSASSVIRGQLSQLHSSTSSSDSKQAVRLDATTVTATASKNSGNRKPSIAAAIATTSTDEKISQLKGQHAQNKMRKQQEQHQKQQRRHQHQHHKKSKYNNKRRKSNKQVGKGHNKYYNKTRSGNRCSINQNKKRRVRYLYSKARSLEKRGLWRESSEILESILELEPKDAHSYLALARLESRRERGGRVGGRQSSRNEDGEQKQPQQQRYENARQIFEIGTAHCPASVHLWHAWAMHEQTLGNNSKARELFEKALELDPWNGYVCHAYGMLEMQSSRSSSAADKEEDDDSKELEGDDDGVKKARQLWQRGLTYQPSAALVTSLGQLYIASGHPHSARELYSTYIPKLTNERERIEVYLAAASLEETAYGDVEKASHLLKEALARGDGNVQHDSRAYVALARLGTSGGLVDDLVVKKRLKEICVKQLKRARGQKDVAAFSVKDGRLFNAWAKLESKSNNLREARKILRNGRMMYPRDHTLLQAAGNIEERLGNVTGARDLYSASLHLEPSAPALIAYAMLELRSPEEGKKKQPNITMVRKLLNEALLIDPKHGPVYNALGNLERREGNPERAKRLYQDGIEVNCTDAPSVYHGLAKLHLSLGEVEEARSVLQQGLAMFDNPGRSNSSSSSSSSSSSNSTTSTYDEGGFHNNAATTTSAYSRRNENVAFLAHTLAMIEINVNNNAMRAKEALRLGLWHCRNSPQLLLAMGLCESRLGNENAARYMFERSLTADQKHAQAWQAFGVMEMQSGNFRTAKTLFECGLKNSPTHGALWQAYGTLESWKGHISEARLLFAAGIQKCPQHVPLYQAWACLELRSGDVITAKRLIGEALTKDKRNGSGWLVAAKIEEKMGNAGLVGLILRRGIECAPGDVELYRALAEHEINRGKIDSARELLEKGIEINPLHAPLYHSLAELEARVFNIEGLAKLNKRTAEIFSSDATAPPPSSSKRMQAWGSKIKQGRSAKIPDGIAALAQKIGVDSDTNASIAGGSLEDVDPESLINSMCGFGDEGGSLMFQDMPDVGR